MLFETIRVLDGVPQFIGFHQQRLDRTRRELQLDQGAIDLEKVIEIPDAYRTGQVRCRIDYERTVLSVRFTSWACQPVRYLALAERVVSYSCKWSNRQDLDRIRAEFQEYDDVVITRDGYLTDTTIANIALEKDGAWYTPARPLLAGTARARLIEAGEIQELAIHRDQLEQFSRITIFNALRGFDPTAALPISRLAVSS